jgi:hypothetical protein
MSNEGAVGSQPLALGRPFGERIWTVIHQDVWGHRTLRAVAQSAGWVASAENQSSEFKAQKSRGATRLLQQLVKQCGAIMNTIITSSNTGCGTAPFEQSKNVSRLIVTVEPETGDQL